jgi:sialidase-1
MQPYQNEVYSATLTPWRPAHPRNDHQGFLQLSNDRILFFWCEYYITQPDRAFASAYTEFRSMDASPCRISGKISNDNGRSWSDTIALQENVGADNVKHPNIVRLSSGRILFSYTVRDIKNQDLRIYQKYSDDECESWSESIQISPKDGVYFTNADHILIHSSGRILLPCHAGPFYGKGDHWEAFCLYSDDDGESWSESSKKIDLPKRGAEEPAIVERRDGSLLAMLRTSLGLLYQATSYDRGETWDEPEPTLLDSPSAATCLKRIPATGDLLLLWNNAKPYWMTIEGSDATHHPRNPLTCTISCDDGVSWELLQDIENRHGYSAGYPSVSFFGDEVFIAYYANVNSGTVGIVSEIKLKIFPVNWFYETSPRRI